MPRNRADVAREAKVEEIVDTARLRLVEGGFAELSVTGIARELGVAPGAIYWYFPTRDDLFVAAVERVFHDILSRKPRSGGCLDHVLWFAERLSEIQDLRLALRERGRVSGVAAKFERDITELLRVMLANALRNEVTEPDIDDVTSAVLALCEGALLQRLSRRARRDVISFGFRRLVETRPASS